MQETARCCNHNVGRGTTHDAKLLLNRFTTEDRRRTEPSELAQLSDKSQCLKNYISTSKQPKSICKINANKVAKEVN